MRKRISRIKVLPGNNSKRKLNNTGGINLMAMNGTQLKGVTVDQNKSKIIKSYKGGIKIHILADEYNIEIDTLCRRLKKWGVKLRKGDFKKKSQERIHFRRKFSPELQAKMRENTRVNNDYIKHCEFKHRSLDQRLIARILLR